MAGTASGNLSSASSARHAPSRPCHEVCVRAGKAAPAYHDRSVEAPKFALMKRTKAPATVYDLDAFSPKNSNEKSGATGGKIFKSNIARDHSAGVNTSSSGAAATANPSMRPGLALMPFHLPAM